jgi:hypothetical protein
MESTEEAVALAYCDGTEIEAKWKWTKDNCRNRSMGFISRETREGGQGRSQLKNELGAHSIEYNGVYTFLKEIHRKFETGIKKLCAHKKKV